MPATTACAPPHTPRTSRQGLWALGAGAALPEPGRPLAQRRRSAQGSARLPCPGLPPPAEGTQPGAPHRYAPLFPRGARGTAGNGHRAGDSASQPPLPPYRHFQVGEGGFRRGGGGRPGAVSSPLPGQVPAPFAAGRAAYRLPGLAGAGRGRAR